MVMLLMKNLGPDVRTLRLNRLIMSPIWEGI